MATITTAAAGNWSEAGTWTGGVAPGNGDTVTLSHAITLSDSRIIGTSPAATASPATWDLDIAPSGKLIITGTGKLTLRGYGRHQTATTGDLVAVDLQDGAIFEFDSTLAPTPATDGYDYYSGVAIWSYKRWQGRGAFIIRSVAGAANGRLRGASGGGQGFLCDFDGVGSKFLLQRLGRSGTLPGVSINGGAASTNYIYAFTDGIIDACWGIHGYTVYGGAGTLQPSHDTRLKRITSINAPTGAAYDLSLAAGAAGGVPHYIEDCAFELPYWAQGSGIDVRQTSFLQGYSMASSGHQSWDDNLVRTLIAVSTQPAAVINREYRIAAQSAANTKLLQLTAYCGALASTDHIFEALHSGGDDGEYIATNTGFVGTGTLNAPIFIPQHDGRSLRWAEWNHDAAIRVVVNHATGGAVEACLGFGHSGDTGITTNRGELRNSIVANFRDAVGGTKVSYISFDHADGALPANVVNNCGYRLAASRYPSAGGIGYGLKQTDTAAIMGAGDVDVDPWPNMSTDPATRRGLIRRLSSWGRLVLGLTGTDAEVEDAALRAIHVRHIPTHSEYISGATIPALYQWVREGWAPTNMALATAGEGGTFIGAVQPVATPSASSGRGGLSLSLSLNL